ncbi:MAG: hypothetical protein QOE01_682 [Actinomycetota bacterium]|nr:hypothetical protein [Actinomycetota bacterium]
MFAPDAECLYPPNNETQSRALTSRQEVTTMESIKTNTRLGALTVVTDVPRTWEPMGASGHTQVRLATPYAVRAKGTGMSAVSAFAAGRITAVTSQLPILGAVVIDGSWIRAWSPPV